MYYILTTYFQNHWDQITSNRTYYSKQFLDLKSDQIVNNTPTIFLRINKVSKNIEKAWVGKIYDIEETQEKINYSVHIDTEIELEPEFTRTKIGWFVIDEKLDINREQLNQEVHHELNIQELSGNWKKGWALDLHTLHSVKLPNGSFDTKRTKVGEYLYQLKYCKNKSYGNKIISIAEEFTESPDFQTSIYDISVIIPVPPSDTGRAFQPVYELTEELSKKITIPADYDYLKKLKPTSQIKSVENIDDRRNILKDSFDVTDERYKDKNLLLFDDLYRSGVTLEEITNVLKQKGKVKDVYVLTITKTRTKR